MKPECPSCGGALAKLPTRKTKCPHCGQYMFVKYTPTDPVKRLVTEARATEIELEWAARYEATRQVNVAAAREMQLRSRANMVRNAAIIPKARFLAGPTAHEECVSRHGRVFDVSDPLFQQLAPCERDTCACVWVSEVPGYTRAEKG